MKGLGPIYGVPLIETLPLSGGMRQQMPSQADLTSIKDRQFGMRVVAGYEILLNSHGDLRKALEHVKFAYEAGGDFGDIDIEEITTALSESKGGRSQPPWRIERMRNHGIRLAEDADGPISRS